MAPTEWTQEEDDRLTLAVNNYVSDPRNDGRSIAWIEIAREVQTRTNNQCAVRWSNHLAPGINTGPWTEFEDAKIRHLVKQWGNAYGKIADELPGRTANSVKNRWQVLKTCKPGAGTTGNALAAPPQGGTPLHGGVRASADIRARGEAARSYLWRETYSGQVLMPQPRLEDSFPAPVAEHPQGSPPVHATTARESTYLPPQRVSARSYLWQQTHSACADAAASIT